MKQVVLVDTGIGNLRSVQRALEAASDGTVEVVRTNDPEVVRRASRVVVPGQSAFRDVMEALSKNGVDQALGEAVRAGTPYFGMCLGLQVLFEGSEESEGVPGLGWFRGKVQKLVAAPGIKIPHMGWNQLELPGEPHPYLAPVGAGAWFYFVHSFHGVPEDKSLLEATVSYGPNQVTAAVGRDNVFATQFHPEKSQGNGLKLLQTFLLAPDVAVFGEAMEIIPAIDLLEGKAVRLRQGRYEEVTVYSDNPPVLAAGWSGRVRRVHVVDLEGARAGRPVQGELVQRIVSAFGSGVQVGGGVRTLAAVDAYFALGVDRVVLGTAAIRDPQIVRDAAKAYPGRVIVAVDARGGLVATDGWLDQSERQAIDVVRELSDLDLAAVLYTDIERDGTEVGPNVAETARLAKDGGLAVIASGGVGTLEHVSALAASSGIVGAIVGRALHERRFTLEEAAEAARPRPKS